MEAFNYALNTITGRWWTLSKLHGVIIDYLSVALLLLSSYVDAMAPFSWVRKLQMFTLESCTCTEHSSSALLCHHSLNSKWSHFFMHRPSWTLENGTQIRFLCMWRLRHKRCKNYAFKKIFFLVTHEQVFESFVKS